MGSSQQYFPSQQNNPAAAIPTWQGAKFYYHLNAATGGYQVASGPGVLLRLIAGTPAAGTIGFYDGTSTSGGAMSLVTMTTGTLWGFMDYGIQFVNGLYIVVTGAPDLTITYLT